GAHARAARHTLGRPALLPRLQQRQRWPSHRDRPVRGTPLSYNLTSTRTTSMRENRSTPLTIPSARFRALGHELVDNLADFLDSLPERRVAPPGGPQELRALLGHHPLPEQGADPGELLAEATTLLVENSTFNAHPRFFGYITAPAAPIGILGDLLASAINANCGGWTLSPM